MKPILFNTEMVRAILAGRKSVTRRVVKPQPMSKLAYVCMGYKHGTWSYPGDDAWKYWDDESFRLPDGLDDKEKARRWAPPCHTGDVLYVRETWAAWIDLRKAGAKGHLDQFYYKADSNFPDVKWHPSIHMPREAARIFLRVTDVRVEKLQDITKWQAADEGQPGCSGLTICGGPSGCRLCEAYSENSIKWFEGVWDSTIKKADRALYGWAANPWVWVIEFERCEKPKEM